MSARSTAVYASWIDSIEDIVTRAGIQVRVERLLHGHPGNHRRLPGGIRELKMEFGPGYRVDYTEREGDLVVLCGGDKASQQRDIQTAIALAQRL